MCRRVKAVLFLSIFAILCGCQHIYGSALGTILAEAADAEEVEPAKIKGYRTAFEEADGENGFYRKMPSVTVENQDEDFATRYQFLRPGGTGEEGMLDSQNPCICWEEGGDDGIYELHLSLVYIKEPEEKEDTDKKETQETPEEIEKELEKWKKDFRWEVDSKPPSIHILSPEKQDWYRGTVSVEAQAEDEGSGLAHVEGKEQATEIPGNEDGTVAFTVTGVSRENRPVQIIITAVDLAGNRARRELLLYIDRSSPVLEVEGAKDYSITGTDQKLTFRVREENRCRSTELKMEREAPSGEREELTLTDWQEDGDGRYLTAELVEDGIYRFDLTAADEAGNQSRTKRQIIIDKSDPVIQGVERFRGRWMKEFSWNYGEAHLVDDFTTSSYQVMLDGCIYRSGERIFREGRHQLQITALDAAGNKASADADFVIDRTPPGIICEDQENKEEVGDGAKFEEQAVLQVRTENTDDRLTKIEINGKSQVLPRDTSVFRFTLEEVKNYEILCTAEDRAGNKTERGLLICVEKKKDWIEKVVGPVRKLFLKEEPEGTSGRTKRDGSFHMMIVCLMLTGLLGAGAYGSYYRKKKRR